MMTTFSPRAPRAMDITAKAVPPMAASASPPACFSFSRSQNIRFRKSTPVSRPLERRHRKLVAVVASSAAGLYSAEQFDLTLENVDKVLDNVRPYLIADGGNVSVVSVADGVVSLKLQGACGSCPSSTTTMKMGIEKVLKEKFGDDLKDICQVSDDQNVVATVEAVNAHLEILRPAIKNYGGSVEAFSVVEGECRVKYVGPDSIGSGIKATIKEKFPDIFNVEFIS